MVSSVEGSAAIDGQRAARDVARLGGGQEQRGLCDLVGLTDAPAVFTAINKDTSELWHELVPFNAALAQTTSDKAVRILQACDAGEWLPRHTADPEHFECSTCAWKQRCWA